MSFFAIQALVPNAGLLNGETPLEGRRVVPAGFLLRRDHPVVVRHARHRVRAPAVAARVFTVAAFRHGRARGARSPSSGRPGTSCWRGSGPPARGPRRGASRAGHNVPRANLLVCEPGVDLVRGFASVSSLSASSCSNWFGIVFGSGAFLPVAAAPVSRSVRLGRGDALALADSRTDTTSSIVVVGRTHVLDGDQPPREPGKARRERERGAPTRPCEAPSFVSRGDTTPLRGPGTPTEAVTKTTFRRPARVRPVPGLARWLLAAPAGLARCGVAVAPWNARFSLDGLRRGRVFDGRRSRRNGCVGL
mmetsp:Transcript_11560/g.26035  ORF Transcript_11560/g.26035 Transcript_11560/m.26035 type:complete len:306 (+) Transcript_11560:607-1524(+)